jgi:hypothetical protein
MPLALQQAPMLEAAQTVRESAAKTGDQEHTHPAGTAAIAAAAGTKPSK